MKMRNDKPKVRPFNPVGTWSPLDLIILRNDCHAGMVRVENALDEYNQKNTPIPESVRKNTTVLIDTLRSAMIALQDLESERNIATHNAMTEKASHARTIGQLDEANKTIQQLTLDGSRLRAAIEKLMSK
jgi:hypothetical protein